MGIQYLVMTDLDGTLLDHDDYSWESASEALALLKEKNIPVIANTSKTMAEVETLIKELRFDDEPYVVENGSAIIFPNSTVNGYSKKILEEFECHDECKVIDGQYIWSLGKDRKDVCNWLYGLRTRHNWLFEGYSDWSVEALMEKTGLSKNKAIESKQKLFSEPFQWFDTEENFKVLESLAIKNGFTILKGGRFYHIQGNVDKSSPFSFFKKYHNLFWPESKSVQIIALGDGENDVAMLDAADYGVCIRSPVNDFPTVNANEVIFSKQYGPKGWNEEMLTLTNSLLI